MRVDPGFAITAKSFTGRTGGSEHYITVEPAGDGDFASQLDSVTRQYAEAVRVRGLAPESAIFRRILVSDVLNQEAAVNASPLVQDPAAGPVAVSLVQQPPLPGRKIALLAYHVDGDASLAKQLVAPRHMVVHKAGLRHLWSTRLLSGRRDHNVSSFDETTELFEQLDRGAGRAGRHAGSRVRAHLAVCQRRGRVLPGPGGQPHGFLRPPRPDPRHPLHRQHRHRGRRRAPLRGGGDGRLFRARPEAGADRLPERFRPAVRHP